VSPVPAPRCRALPGTAGGAGHRPLDGCLGRGVGPQLQRRPHPQAQQQRPRPAAEWRLLPFGPAAGALALLLDRVAGLAGGLYPGIAATYGAVLPLQINPFEAIWSILPVAAGVVVMWQHLQLQQRCCLLESVVKTGEGQWSFPSSR